MKAEVIIDGVESDPNYGNNARLLVSGRVFWEGPNDWSCNVELAFPDNEENRLNLRVGAKLELDITVKNAG